MREGRLAAAQREPREARDGTVGAGGRGYLAAMAVVDGSTGEA
jgi:hypothetical protein